MMRQAALLCLVAMMAVSSVSAARGLREDNGDLPTFAYGAFHCGDVPEAQRQCGANAFAEMQDAWPPAEWLEGTKADAVQKFNEDLANNWMRLACAPLEGARITCQNKWAPDVFSLLFDVDCGVAGPATLQATVSANADGTERPEWLGPKLAKVVEDISWGLDALTASPVLGVDATGRDIVKLAAMPKTAVVHAEGLAFVRRKKKGAIFGMTKERVVLMRRSALPDGTVVWSGPVFLRAKSFSLGLTWGSFHMEICTAIMNDKGMHSVLRPHRNLCFNAAFLVDMNGNRVRRLHTSSSGAQSQVTMDKDGGMMAKYYLMEAGMVDLSCQGGSFGLDDQLNYAAYGPGFDAQLVLQGKLAPPPEFQPVYNRLNEFAKEVRALHPQRQHDLSMRGGAPATRISRHGSLQHSDKGRRSSESAEAQPQGSMSPPRAGPRSPSSDGGSGRHAHFGT
ncbi:hypothetical protein ABPG77_004462 [Micractinium sp. CCAP 211/92]